MIHSDMASDGVVSDGVASGGVASGGVVSDGVAHGGVVSGSATGKHLAASHNRNRSCSSSDRWQEPRMASWIEF